MNIGLCFCIVAVLQREVTWNKDYHVIYIDNPVKTGFSFTQVDEGLVTSEEQIAEYLYRYESLGLGLRDSIYMSMIYHYFSTLYQFFQVFPKYQKCPFYITGEVRIIPLPRGGQPGQNALSEGCCCTALA